MNGKMLFHLVTILVIANGYAVEARIKGGRLDSSQNDSRSTRNHYIQINTEHKSSPPPPLVSPWSSATKKNVNINFPSARKLASNRNENPLEAFTDPIVDYAIRGSNDSVIPHIDNVEECARRCISTTKIDCRSFEYQSESYQCVLSMSLNPILHVTGWKLYLRSS